MKRITICLVGAAAFLLAAGGAGAALGDPYEVLNRHIEAVGGLQTLKAERTSYTKGTVKVVGAGLEGTFESWSEVPLKSRQEVDLGVFQQVTGDNGEFRWTVDANGKVQKNVDEETVKDRRLAKLQAEFEYLDPESPHFQIELTGTDTVGEHTCYVIEVANDINDDISVQYFDTASFLQLKSTQITSEATTHTEYADWREVGGILRPFKQVSTVMPMNMVQEIEFEVYEPNVEIDPARFEPPGTDVKDFRFTEGNSAENVGFELIAQHIFFPVTVKCDKRLWVMDSGAGSTVIDRTYAEELGLKIEGDIKGRGAGNLVDVSFTTLPPFTMEGLEFDEQKVTVIDLQQIMHNIMGLDVVGILGYDFLSRFTTRVDYAAELISFYDPDSFVYDGPGVVLEAPVSQSNMFHIPLTVDGEYGGKWNLDLGAGGMDFHYPYAEEHGLLDREGIQRMGFGAGGSIMSRSVRFKTIELAGFMVDDVTVGIPSGGSHGAFGNKELTGNIGNDLLRRFVLYLDYKNGQVIVEKGAEFDSYVPKRDNSGLQVAYNDDDDVVVLYVSPGTPAEKAGLEVDDVLKSFNGIAVEHLDGLLAVRELLREPPGTEYEIDFVRDGDSKAAKLRLKKLL